KTTASEITVKVNNAGSGSGGGGNTFGNAVLWVDDSLPNGAVPGTDGPDSWNWINNNPAPFSGSIAHQSQVANGLHQHYFDWASQTLSVGAGEVLFAYVFLDPANLPAEIMLQWDDCTWEHRAFWGDNNITDCKS